MPCRLELAVRVEVGVKRLDRSRHLGADLNGGHWLKRTGRADFRNDVAARYGCGNRRRRLARRARAVIEDAAPNEHNGDHDQNQQTSVGHSSSPLQINWT